jgi:hypothetical protein
VTIARQIQDRIDTNTQPIEDLRDELNRSEPGYATRAVEDKWDKWTYNEGRRAGLVEALAIVEAVYGPSPSRQPFHLDMWPPLPSGECDHPTGVECVLHSWTVSGDLRRDDSESNHDVRDRLRGLMGPIDEVSAGLSFDCETSCFFAYTRTGGDAEWLVDKLRLVVDGPIDVRVAE